MLHFLFLFTFTLILFFVFWDKNNKYWIYLSGMISSIRVFFTNLALEYREFYVTLIEFFIIEKFHLILPIIVFYSILTDSYKILIIILFLKLKDWLMNLDIFKDVLKMILKDQATISGHWSNDFDLIWIRRTSYALILIGLAGVGYLKFISLNNITNLLISSPAEIPGFISSNSEEGIVLFLCLIGLGILIDFFAEIHIIFYRNFPVDGKVISTCIKCGKIVATGVVTVNVLKIPLSYVPGVEPTLVGNKYQQTFGRGYGFATGRDHLHHFSFENLGPIKNGEVPISNFLDEKGVYSVEKANTFLKKPKNLEWAKKNLSLADCQNLGITKGNLF